MTRDIFELSRSWTLHFPLIENIQSFFCTLEGVVALILPLRLASSPSDKVGDIAERVMGNGKKIGKSPALNCAVVNYKLKHKRRQQR